MTLGGTTVDLGAVLTVRQARVGLSCGRPTESDVMRMPSTLSKDHGGDEHDMDRVKETVMHAAPARTGNTAAICVLVLRLVLEIETW